MENVLTVRDQKLRLFSFALISNTLMSVMYTGMLLSATRVPIFSEISPVLAWIGMFLSLFTSCVAVWIYNSAAKTVPAPLPEK